MFVVATQRHLGLLPLAVGVPRNWRHHEGAVLLIACTTAVLIRALSSDHRGIGKAPGSSAPKRSRLPHNGMHSSGSKAGRNDLSTAFMSNSPFASYVKDADGALLLYNRHLAHLAEMSGVTEEVWLALKDSEGGPAGSAASTRVARDPSPGQE